MKTVGSSLATHLAAEATTLCTLWKLTRADGTVQGFTDHDADLIYSGVTYLAATGYTRSALSGDAGLSVDNLELEGIIASGSLSADDIRAGLYDWCELLVSIVNYADLTQGAIILRRGRLGQFVLREGVFTTELRGLSQGLSRTFIEVTNPSCRADLGDARCKVNMAAHTETGSVSTISTQRRIFTASITGGRASGYFDGGLLEWTTGLNDGHKQEVKIVTGSSVELYLPAPRDLTAGDTFSVQAGCDKLLATCISKFNNVLNFRGEPWIPGTDLLTRTPNATTG